MSDILIREATINDLPEILRHRRGMYEAMGYTDANALSAMLSTCGPYLAAALANGSFRSWLALEAEEAIGGGAVLINPWPSHPYDLECRRGNNSQCLRGAGLPAKRYRSPVDANHDRLVQEGRLRRGLPARQRTGQAAV